MSTSLNTDSNTRLLILQADVWPFHCGQASIVKLSDKHEFIQPIYECCLRCDFPAFTECVVKRKKENFADWVCPSEGLHCIVGCVNKNKPGLETASSLRPAPRPDKQGVAPDLGEKVPNLGRCEKLDTENGNRCVRKLCIPLSLKPWVYSEFTGQFYTDKDYAPSYIINILLIVLFYWLLHIVKLRVYKLTYI